MRYDIVAKRLLELGKKPILQQFVGIEADRAELLELPRERVSVRATDFALRVSPRDGDDFIQILEFQTYWDPRKLTRLLEYRLRYMDMFPELEVRAAMLLFQPDERARDFYRGKDLTFRFELIKLWEVEGSVESDVHLLPFIVLMKNGEGLALEAERRIYDSPVDRKERAELLTSMAILAGLRSPELSRLLIERRRDIMIESPAYEWIRSEGREEGLKQGHLDVARRLLAEGCELEFIARMTGVEIERLRELARSPD